MALVLLVDCMDDKNAFEFTVAGFVVVVTIILYIFMAGMDALFSFFVTRWFLFLAASFFLLPILELAMGGFRGLRENASSTILIILIGVAFVVLYMMVTGSTTRMTFERSLEYVLYALPISYFAGKVKQQIMEGIR